MLPETFRFLCNFSVTSATDFKPMGPLALAFARIRVISQGTLLSDESYADRLTALHHLWMSTDQ